MNIAILIPSLTSGGAERVAAELSKYLSGKGYCIYIFTEQKKYVKYDFKGKIIKFQCNADYRNTDTWYVTIMTLIKKAVIVRRLKKRYEIDITISFMEEYNMVNVLSRSKDWVVIRSCTVLSKRDDSCGKIYNPKLIHFLYNKADRVVAISKYGKRDMVNYYGVKKHKIRVIPNSVETSVEDEYKESWKYGENTIISVARVNAVKQQLLLVDVFSKVKEAIPDAKLILVGNNEGKYAWNVKKKIIEKHLENDIIFTGHIKNVKYYLDHSKVFVLLSKVEGFGNSIIEAMAREIPVVCMDSPGGPREILAPHTKSNDLSEIEYGKYGILVPYVDENVNSVENSKRKELISKAVIDIISDAEMREFYSKEGRKRANKFNITNIGKMWDEVLEKAER